MTDFPTDADLVRAAQAGDVPSVGLLLERHRAGMHTIALMLLGYSHEAQDAVQDSMLTVLQQIGQLRDPDAVKPWLHMIVRNACRMRLRGPRALPSLDLAALQLPSAEPSPEELLDTLALREWVWHALDDLSQPLRLVVMLRYFSAASSYEQIASFCGVPVGTVRSRLNQAKRKLVDALQATTSLAHTNVTARTAARRRDITELYTRLEQGDGQRETAALFWQDVEVITPGGDVFCGVDVLAHGHNQDLEAGVRLRLTEVIAASDLTVVEGVFLNPADDPTHCPPHVAMVYFLRDERVHRMRFFHPVQDVMVDNDTP